MTVDRTFSKNKSLKCPPNLVYKTGPRQTCRRQEEEVRRRLQCARGPLVDDDGDAYVCVCVLVGGRVEASGGYRAAAEGLY